MVVKLFPKPFLYSSIIEDMVLRKLKDPYIRMKIDNDNFDLVFIKKTNENDEFRIHYPNKGCMDSIIFEINKLVCDLIDNGDRNDINMELIRNIKKDHVITLNLSS